jgi:hypothetical protein
MGHRDGSLKIKLKRSTSLADTEGPSAQKKRNLAAANESDVWIKSFSWEMSAPGEIPATKDKSAVGALSSVYEQQLLGKTLRFKNIKKQISSTSLKTSTSVGLAKPCSYCSRSKQPSQHLRFLFH